MSRTNPEKMKVLTQVSRPEIVMAVARKPRTNVLFFGGSDFSVYEMTMDSAGSQPVELGRHGSYVTGLAIAGQTLISGSYDGRLKWWDLKSRSLIRTVDAHEKYVRKVVATPDGMLVVSVADDMVCRIWDVASGRIVRELAGHAKQTPQDFPSMLFSCAVSADGRYLATGDKVGHVIIWEIESGAQVATVDAPALYTWDPVQRLHSIGGIRSLAFSLDGKMLAVGGIGQIGNIDHLDAKPRVELFDWRTGHRDGEFLGENFKGLVEHLEWHPTGEWLIAAGGYSDGFLLFYDVKARKSIAQEKMPFYVHDLALNETGETIYAVGHEKIALVSVAS